ncbi:MAG: hypothetical protein H7331_02290 [Bacteroidia bacterium]|nr:hypothetical protein [Bacteroidia bacterium]
METTRKVIIVDKETIAELSFPAIEVLITIEEITQRKLDAERATLLGNNEHSKVKITFEDSMNVKQTETTIWGTTDKRIILKGGMVIPLHRIHEIKYL